MTKGENCVEILMLVSIIAATLNSCVLNKMTLKSMKKVFGFNLICSLVWLVILSIVKGGLPKLDGGVIFWGVAYGFIQSMFILFKTLAMNKGSVAITTLIGNSSLFISIIVSFLIWGEPIGAWDIFGLLILCAAIVLCTFKKTEESCKASWKYYAIFFLIFAASVGLVFKAFGKSDASQLGNDMMVVSAVFMTLFYTVAYLVCGKDENNERDSGGMKGFILAAVISGILSCVYNRLNIFLSGTLDAVIFFPFFNGGVILLSTLAGIYLCREKLKKTQLLGIALGVAAICIIGVL